MPTPAQVENRRQRRDQDRHVAGTVTAAGPPATVDIDPGGAIVTAIALNQTAYAVGARVLVLITPAGNYVIGKLA